MTYETLHKAMTDALKAGHKEEKNAIAGFIAQIQKTAIDKGCRDNISEELVNAELLKIKKSIQEQIDTCPASRLDLMIKYTNERRIIDEFAPSVIDDEATIRENILAIANGATIDKPMRGKIMKDIKASGKLYDMATANRVIVDLMNV